MDDLIYLDNAATTPVSMAVISAMTPYFSSCPYNPSAFGGYADRVRTAIQHAKQQVMEALNADSGDVIFTSGGTESNNLAILGYARLAAERGWGKHIITTAIEHDSVLNACHQLEKEGFSVTYLPVNSYGLPSCEVLTKSITPSTVLVSTMAVNNEIGTTLPISLIGDLCKRHGNEHLAFHVDAVQAVGHQPLDVQKIQCDFLSMSAHKFHGPKGVGALYCAKEVAPVMFGGGQQRGIRPGTENVPGIVGLGEAIERAVTCIDGDNYYVSRLRARLEGHIANGLTAMGVEYHMRGLGSHILSLTIPGMEAEALLMEMELYGVVASAGSACHTSSVAPSHVLKAIGLSDEDARCTIRMSLDADLLEADISQAAQALLTSVEHLKELSAVSGD